MLFFQRIRNYFVYRPFTTEELQGYYERSDLSQLNASAEIASYKYQLIKRYLGSSLCSVIDIGCGNGALLNILRQRHPSLREVCGVDGSEYALKQLGPAVQGIKVDLNVEDIPVPSQHFDCALCLDCLEHVFVPEQIMAEIARILSPRGIAVIKVPSSGFLTNTPLVPRAYHSGHLRYYNKVTALALCHDLPLAIVSDRFYHEIPFCQVFMKLHVYRLLQMLLKIIPARLYPFFGSHVLVIKKRGEKL